MVALTLKKLHPATSWLEILSAALPATGVLVVGAGNGNGIWVQWLHDSGVRPAWLVEGDKGQFHSLQHRYPSKDDWLLRRDIVVTGEGEPFFHQASNPRESGLLPPEQLRALWPNLQSIEVEAVNAGVTLDALQADGNLPINWLVLDCLPAASLLQGGKHLLSRLDVVVSRVTTLDQLPSASLKAADIVLNEIGLRRIQILPERHPALAYAIYVRDVADQKAEAERNKLEIDQLQQKLRQAQHRLEQLQAEHEVQFGGARHQAEQAVETVRQQMDELQQQTEKQNLQLQSSEQNQKKLQEELENIHTDKSQLQQELELARTAEKHLHHELLLANNETKRQVLEQQRLQSLNEGILSELYALLDKVVTTTQQLVQQQTQQTQLQQQGQKDLPALLKKELDVKLGKAVRHIEAFIAIQQYLTHGDGITGFHGWPISPDLGVFLLERLRERQYDVIIEFGSGTSTLLIAKALQAFNLLNDGESKHILTFDHDTYYFEKTQNLLASHKVDSLVDLRLVPLKEWSDQTGNYRYYSCHDALTELAGHLRGSRKRLLVFVDGPPGNTCPNARYPAVPFMSDLMACHEIDWILDDANRLEEKLSAGLWKKTWLNNDIRFEDEIIKNEKGMFVATTYGKASPVAEKIAS